MNLEIDFDLILESLTNESNIPWEFPDRFNLKDFLNMLKDSAEVDPNWDTDEGIAAKEKAILDNLLNSNDILSFLRLQWGRLCQSLKPKQLESNEKYQQKELTNVFGDIYKLATAQSTVNEFAALLKLDVASLQIPHYAACSEIINGLALTLLQTVGAKLTSKVDFPFKTFSSMSNEEKGKIRYVGGWTLRKLQEQARRYINSNISSESKQVREKLKTEITKSKILNGLLTNSLCLHHSSKFKETLEITDEKQYRTQGLAHMSDSAYLFFGKLEERRVKYLNHALLNLLKGDLVSDSLASVQKDEELYGQWCEVCNELKSDLTQNEVEKVTQFNDCVNELYKLATQKYFRMGAGQYLRDCRRDFEWKKSEAHRKKVLMKSQKKALQTDKINIDDIRADDSANKSKSHNMLVAMIAKHPRIFHDTRLYTNKDITLLLQAYGIHKKGKKEILADTLVAAISANTEMKNTDIF